VRRRPALVAAACWIGVLVVAPAAAAQSIGPSPTPRVDGEISGVLSRGGTLTIRVEALMPGGWEGLHLVEVAVGADGRELERMRYDIEDARLALAEQEMVVGTGDVVVGQWLRVAASRVVVTTGAGHLTFTATAEVLRDLPPQTGFELSVTGDRGERAVVTRRIADPEPEGLSWGTVLAAVVAALFAGGFVGNLYASRRRPPPRLSIYGAIQRRLEEERSQPGGTGR